MKRALVTHLRDPIDGTPLSLKDAAPDGAEIESGTLVAEGGGSYVIVGGIPNMLSEAAFAVGQKETVESFSFKWRKATGYRRETLPHYTKWYLDRYGFGTEESLASFLRDKRVILDAGTAHGRDAELYERSSTATVYGVDISDGIVNAYRDLGAHERLNFIRGDLTKLPFPKPFFDFIGCDQVLHHTPNTSEALTALCKHLRPGGHILFYVYKKKAPIREFCDDYIRERTTKMSPEDCMEVSEQLTHFGKALSDMKITIDVPVDIPILGIKAGKQDLQRFIYWNMFKCYWNDTMDWDANVITNFDWYHPLHAHRHTPDEVRGWCAAEGLAIEHFDEQESGISVRAKKAA